MTKAASTSRKKPKVGAKKRPGKAAAPAPAPPPAEPAVAVTAWRQVNRQQLAELMGVHPDTVTDYARGGMPVIARGGAGRKGVYDAVACLDWWRSQQGKNAKEAAQTRAYEATAALNEQRLQERRKELVARDQVVLAGQGYTKAWTAKVRALPRRFIEAGVITRDQEAAAATVCRDVLTEIASWRTMADVASVARRKGR
jgi:hypothetical protein